MLDRMRFSLPLDAEDPGSQGKDPRILTAGLGLAGRKSDLDHAAGIGHLEPVIPGNFTADPYQRSAFLYVVAQDVILIKKFLKSRLLFLSLVGQPEYLGLLIDVKYGEDGTQQYYYY